MSKNTLFGPPKSPFCHFGGHLFVIFWHFLDLFWSLFCHFLRGGGSKPRNTFYILRGFSGGSLELQYRVFFDLFLTFLSLFDTFCHFLTLFGPPFCHFLDLFGVTFCPFWCFSNTKVVFKMWWALPVASCLFRAFAMPTHYNNLKVLVKMCIRLHLIIFVTYVSCCYSHGWDVYFLIVFLNTLPGVSVQKTLLGCCSVWAWRKSGIKSQATGRAHTIQKVQKPPPKTPKTTPQESQTPSPQKDPLYIYIYIGGSKTGGWKVSFGVQNGGGFWRFPTPQKSKKGPKRSKSDPIPVF